MLSYSEIVNSIDILQKTLHETYNTFKFEEHFYFPSPNICPACHDGTLRVIHGRYGMFKGCSKYPVCRYTRNL
ncbi:MAG: topoisomerase DNA-binding C4 zinc finger domain-containing protein [Patescibacteria group bacterium]